MTRPPVRTCAACGRALEGAEVYYRFHLVLQAEQDLLEVPGEGTGEALASLLRTLEGAPEEKARDWEEQVHWECTGVVCAACRQAVARLIAPPSEGSAPH